MKKRKGGRFYATPFIILIIDTENNIIMHKNIETRVGDTPEGQGRTTRNQVVRGIKRKALIVITSKRD